jgi:hypothetical protein
MFKNKLLLFSVLLGYAFLYIATSYQPRCEDDCEKISNVSQALSGTRPYVFTVRRCTNQAVSDTLCIFVRDTAGINWSLFADTACMTATQYGLPRQKILVINVEVSPYDTVATKICP